MWLETKDGGFVRVYSISAILIEVRGRAFILRADTDGGSSIAITTCGTMDQAKAAARRLADLIANAPRKTFVSLSEWAEDTAAEQV